MFTLHMIDAIEAGDYPGIAAAFGTKETVSSSLFCDQCQAVGVTDPAVNRNVVQVGDAYEPRTAEGYFEDAINARWPEKDPESHANDSSAFAVLNAVCHGGWDPIDRRTADAMHHVAGLTANRLASLVCGARNTKPIPPATIVKPSLLKVKENPATPRAREVAKEKT